MEESSRFEINFARDSQSRKHDFPCQNVKIKVLSPTIVTGLDMKDDSPKRLQSEAGHFSWTPPNHKILKRSCQGFLSDLLVCP